MNIISSGQVTTRKAHRCFSCAEMIGKGTLCHVCVYVERGSKPVRLYEHCACHECMQIFTKEVSEEGYHEQDLLNWMQEYDFTGRPQQFLEKLKIEHV